MRDIENHARNHISHGLRDHENHDQYHTSMECEIIKKSGSRP